MRVLVTGTEGYIGAVVPPLLMERGHEVIGVDAGFHNAGWLYRNRVPVSPMTLAKDIRLVDEADLDGVDAIVHMAELSNDPVGQLNPRDHVRDQPQGIACTWRAREAQSESSASSTPRRAACTGSPRTTWSTRSSPTNPQTAYAVCKTLVERDVGAMADDDFSPTFLRNATAYGASPRMRFDIVLNNLSGLAWTTREIRMESDGTPWRPFVHIRDIATSIACALEAPREVVHNEIFNVGNSRRTTRCARSPRSSAPSSPTAVTLAPGGGPDTRSYRVSFDKINERLPGFACGWDASAGRAELHEIFERIDMTARRLRVARVHTAQADRVPASHGADRRRLLLDVVECGSTTTAIPGVFVVELEPRGDERGFFARAFCAANSPSTGSCPRSSRRIWPDATPRGHDARPSLPGRSRAGGEVLPLHPGRDVQRRGRRGARIADVRRTGSACASARPTGSRSTCRRSAPPATRRSPTVPRCLYSASSPTRPRPSAGLRHDDPAIGDRLADAADSRLGKDRGSAWSLLARTRRLSESTDALRDASTTSGARRRVDAEARSRISSA